MHRIEFSSVLLSGRLVLLLAACSVTPAVLGQELSGSVSLGLRGVDVDGAETKYREDLNLDDGPRLRDLNLLYLPGGPDGKVDRVELDIANLGDEPFQSFHVGVRKYGKFDFRADRRRSQYFYADIITPPELADIEASTRGDLHHFDFERVQDTISLDIDLSPKTRIGFDLERYSRTGNSTTTLDIERDEFELEKPVDEESANAGLRLQHAWEKIMLIVEERFGDFENDVELFLPGASVGENTDDPAELAFFRFGQPYSYDSRSHLVRFTARPSDRLQIGGGYRAIDLDLDLDANESSGGIDFLGNPFSTSLTGFAAIERDSEQLELDLTYRATDRLQVLFKTDNRELDQLGRSVLGSESAYSEWLIDTQRVEAGVEIAVGDAVLLSVGWSTEDRDVDATHHGVLEFATTERNGFFAALDFDPAGPLSLSLSVEDDSIDDPDTLSAPTDARRYRLSGRYRWDNGLAINASLRRYDLDNAFSGWRGDTDQADLRLSYALENLELSFGYGAVEYSRDIEQLVTAGFREDLFSIAYGAETDFSDATARYRIGPRIVVGGYLRNYENEGSFAVSRDDRRAFVELDLDADYILQVAYQNVDYREDGFDDYDAEILELAFGLRW